MSYITAFEDALAREARTRGFDGVVCGHIHHAEIRAIGDILYCNSGDWVESLTALVETHDGDAVGAALAGGRGRGGHAARAEPVIVQRHAA